MFTIKGYITNLGAYNEGRLIGEWVTFPCSREDFNAALKRIGIGAPDDCDVPYEETFWTDWDCSCDMGFGEYENFDTVNDIAERIKSLDIDSDVLDCLISMTDTVKEALNIAESGSYTVYYDCDSMADVAYQYVEDNSLLKNVPYELTDYIDYEKYGADMELNGIWSSYRDSKYRTNWVCIYD